MSLETKKGFTLVEVIVALGILAVVFVGTVTLIVNVVNLELSSRNLTEAVAIAQGKLAEAIVPINGGCTASTPTDVLPTPAGEKYTYEINFEDNYNFGGLSNFIKVEVKVNWKDKGLGQREYKIDQIVRKN